MHTARVTSLSRRQSKLLRIGRGLLGNPLPPSDVSLMNRSKEPNQVWFFFIYNCLMSLDETHKSYLIGLVVLLFVSAFGLWRLYASNLDLSASLVDTRETLGETLEENLKLSNDLKVARGDIDEYNSKIDGLSSTLERLKKLAETDRELLKQYSKVYFLNENYVPRGLTDISSVFLSNPTKPQQTLALVYPFLQRLLEEADIDGMDLKILSGYRSFESQTSLKNAYTVTYGAGTANKFSADQGYSEHQLGTTIDFTTTKLGSTISSFAKTPEYKWLLEHAYKHGFILSYSENNPSYIFEPWHWRFVGVALATRLFEEKQEFYTLEQRQIDAYLINLFESKIE